MPLTETTYQALLIKKIQEIFPDCYILRNDPSRDQGIPDLLILWQDRWAMLEVKTTANASLRPNQEWYVGLFDTMSFASFVYPENEEQVLHDLQIAFGTSR